MFFFKKVFDNLQSLQTYNLQATTYNLQPRFIALENKQVWNKFPNYFIDEQ